MIEIKICGLKRMEDIISVNKALPDYCGFVIDVPKSRRNVTPDEVRKLTAKLSPKIIPAGVFVNAPAQMICELAKENVIRMIQLHGEESEETIEYLKKETKKPVIKAFSVAKEADVIQALKSKADYILFDHGAGGTGQSFDWSFLKAVSRPYFLAGGIGVEQLSKVWKLPNLFALDMSSSVETDGVKDEKKMIQMVKEIRKGDK